MPGQAWMWGAAWLAAGILAGVAESGQNSVIIVLGQKLMHFLRSRMAAKLSRLPFSYYTAHSSGEISSHFLNDVDAINVLFTEGIVALSANALKLLAIILVIGRTNAVSYTHLLACWSISLRHRLSHPDFRLLRLCMVLQHLCSGLIRI